ncbi:DUF402 domain-containing protein [Nocardioides sp.]|uniref:DUF402 domain-containing protein n=1 Tax=Nocardioides sp. TaxID=35761 RepID=UPI001A1C1835|nr:DUF402 domain-containing protein [Nocardioides sp.]MBJ7356704.1 DUF402 domain-containing protein [Nocardioides sp.]
MPREPGDPIRVELTKWGDRPHWEFDGLFLGSDEHGDWLGFTAGTLMARPGMEIRPANHQVGLVPTRGAAFLATFHGPGGDKRTYVDMTSVPSWDGSVVRAVDLDLDVVEELDGTVFVDDEDEFAEHQVLFGYPREVVTLAEVTRDSVLAAVTARAAPFDGSAQRWLEVLDELVRG